MYNEQIIFGILSIAIGIISYSFYFRDIYKGKTKPDGFSWLIWSLLAGITFFAQITKGAGPGAWATAFTAVVCLVIACTAFFRGSNKAKIIDWISLGGAVLAIALWKYTNNPLLGVILVIIVGALGFFPTFVKVFSKPSEETLITYLLNATKFAIALLALESFNPVTWLYPAGLVVMNSSLATVIFIRRNR